MTTWVKARWGRLLLAVLALAGVLVVSQVGEEVQATSAVSKATAKVKTKSIKGTVTDSQGRILVGAKVYFIDTAKLDLRPITAADQRTRDAEDRDEPLEDIIRDPVKADALPQAITDSKGRFKAKLPLVRHFAWVEPNNTEYLPGGNASRASFLPSSLPKTGLNIQVSWDTPEDATYIGTTACLVCHDGGLAIDRSGWKTHAHALMYTRASGPTANQDFSKHPGWDDFAAKFLPGTVHTAGTKVNLMNYDKTQSRRFDIKQGAPDIGDTVNFEVYLWKDTNDGSKAKLTVVSVNAGDAPGTNTTYEVAGFMGGYIRQRVLLKIEPTRLGFFRGFQFQAITNSPSQGLDFNYDRNKKPFTESGSGGGGIRDLFDEAGALPVQKLPSAVTKSQISCALCHNGASNQVNKSVGGETLFTTVSDPNGVFATGEAIDGLQDLGITCEQCHGPGSKHREEALLPDTIVSKKVTISHKGKFIVNPDNLDAARGSMICGRCHSAVEMDDPWLKSGASRDEFISEVADNATGPGSPGNRSSIWPDDIHEKGGHHGITYTNYLQSKHYRNDRLMVACYDCHGLHGETDYKRGLLADPDDSVAGLCQTCHLKDIRQHMDDKTGDDMKGLSTKCYQCHMTRTGTGGAGSPGLFIGTPTGNPATDPDIVYWQGDQSSHVWDMPSKMSVGVANTKPGLAMPTPYTNNCGTCHNPSALPFLPPEP